jgi:penicillin amidase
MPRRVNPAEGFLTTSNEMNLPPDYPYGDLKPGFEWTPGWRHERISGVLSQPRPLSIEDSKRLQTDTVSLPARHLTAVLQDLKTDDSDTRAALMLLRGWDGNVTGDSAAAALYETWFTHHLRTAVRNLLMPAAQAATVDGAHVDVIIGFAEHPSRWLKERSNERRDELLGTTLGAAFRELRTRLGNDTSRWRWDSLHFNLSEHPFSAVVDDAHRVQLNVGPLPKDGDAFVPSQSSYRSADFREIGGPSVRVIMDVGDWDNSVAVNHPGQSGDPESPHYRDLADLWRRGEYFPLLFSRQAVERATERIIYLTPSPK